MCQPLLTYFRSAASHCWIHASRHSQRSTILLVFILNSDSLFVVAIFTLLKIYLSAQISLSFSLYLSLFLWLFLISEIILNLNIESIYPLTHCVTTLHPSPPPQLLSQIERNILFINQAINLLNLWFKLEYLFPHLMQYP